MLVFDGCSQTFLCLVVRYTLVSIRRTSIVYCQLESGGGIQLVLALRKDIDHYISVEPESK